MAASLLLVPLLALCAAAAPADAARHPDERRSVYQLILRFFTQAPRHMANSIKLPETVGATTNILPVFWGHPDGEERDESTWRLYRAIVAAVAFGLVALAATQLWRKSREQKARARLQLPVAQPGLDEKSVPEKLHQR